MIHRGGAEYAENSRSNTMSFLCALRALCVSAVRLFFSQKHKDAPELPLRRLTTPLVVAASESAFLVFLVQARDQLDERVAPGLQRPGAAVLPLGRAGHDGVVRVPEHDD